MKASESNIDSFLKKSETVFAIPVYQRNYVKIVKDLFLLQPELFFNTEVLKNLRK